MIKYEVRFLEQAKEFLDSLDSKSREKVLFNIWKPRETNDPELFKKLSGEIWELEPDTKANKLDYLHFGIKVVINQHW